MRVAKNELIFLVSTLIRGFFFGPTIYILFKIAKNNAYLSIILALILSIIPLFIYYKLQNINPKKNIIETINDNFKLGKFINIILILFILFFGSLVLWNIINFIRSLFLYQTPLFFISLIVIIPVIILAQKGIQTISRSSVIYFIINIFLFLLAVFSLSGEIKLDYLMPMEITTFKEILHASLICIAYTCLPMFLLLIVPKNNITSNKKLTKSLSIMYIISYTSLFIVIFYCTTVLGSNMSELYQYPEYHILKTISIGNFFRRVEGVIVLQWLFDGILLLSFIIYFAITALKNIKIIKKKELSSIICSLIIFYLANYIFNNNTQAKEYLLTTQPIINYIFLLIIPTIILIILLIKKKRKTLK